MKEAQRLVKAILGKKIRLTWKEDTNDGSKPKYRYYSPIRHSIKFMATQIEKLKRNPCVLQPSISVMVAHRATYGWVPIVEHQSLPSPEVWEEVGNILIRDAFEHDRLLREQEGRIF